MNLSCARAVDLGLPAVAFTEPVDFTPLGAGHLRETFPQLVSDDGLLVAPEFDAEGYFDSIEECRSRYPELTILTGLEVGQPHRHREQLEKLALFEIVSHIDYAIRLWPDDPEPFSTVDFEEEFRTALRSIAVADLVLEVSAKLPLDPTILGWWREEGGNRTIFGSDGHEPWTLGRGREGVSTMAKSFGFHPAEKPHEPWRLSAGIRPVREPVVSSRR